MYSPSDLPALSPERSKLGFLSPLKHLGLRGKLIALVAVFALSFIVFGIVAYSTVQTVKVGGALYLRIVQGKDLVADILPPPEYLIEAYLVVLDMAEETDAEQLKKLAEMRWTPSVGQLYSRNKLQSTGYLRPQAARAFCSRPA